MGSACFARGNREVIAALNKFMSERSLRGRILVRGALCQGACSEGPHISINGTPYRDLGPSQCIDIVRELMGETR